MDDENADEAIIDEEIHKLEEDQDTPSSPPDDVNEELSTTNQRTDSEIDSHELYDEGLEGATETDPDLKGPNI